VSIREYRWRQHAAGLLSEGWESLALSSAMCASNDASKSSSMPDALQLDTWASHSSYLLVYAAVSLLCGRNLLVYAAFSY